MPHPFRVVPATLWDIVFTSCPVPLAVLNDHLEFELVNDAFCQLLQRPRSQLLLRGFQEVTRAEDIGPDLALADRVRRDELPGYSLVKAFLAPDWSLTWVQVSVQAYREDGRLVCLYLSAVPVHAPVTAQRVSHRGAAGPKGWLSENWRYLIAPIIGLVAASYAFYARLAVKDAEAEALKHRIELLEKKEKP